MADIGRRKFIGGAAVAGAALVAAGTRGLAQSARATDSRVEVLVGE